MARAEPISEEHWPEIAYFADQCRKAREELQLNQRNFANMLGLSQPYIAALESRRINPQYQTMIALARAMNKPISYFILEMTANPDDDTKSTP